MHKNGEWWVSRLFDIRKHARGRSLLSHSYLNATIGFTRIARRAGSQQANSAVAMSTAGASVKAMGSSGLTW